MKRRESSVNRVTTWRLATCALLFVLSAVLGERKSNQPMQPKMPSEKYGRLTKFNQAVQTKRQSTRPDPCQ